MIEHVFSGGRSYWGWVAFLFIVIGVGTLFYLRQFQEGLYITGMGRDVSWGLYIAQFTFLVGVAASAVMVVLPYYLHDYKAFGKITILGEFLAIGAVVMCMTFIFVDMGQPFRILNVFLHPSLRSMMFWDTIALSGYLVLNMLIGFVTLEAERRSVPPSRWIKPIIILSIPWAISIHTVTAFLYAGLAARPFWMTAVLAPRFLASAFSAGPALLLLICLIQKLSVIVTYAMAFNVFLILMELFTAVYSGIPEHLTHFQYMFFGLEGHSTLVPWMWTSATLAVLSLVLLLVPRARRNEKILIVACLSVFFSIWIDKGLGMVVTGFIPNPLGEVAGYWPTVPELFITLGVYGMGVLIVTVLYKIALSVRHQLPTQPLR